ncbi:MAG TPA: J domain-containing protein [Ferrovibrio sp.]|uniref:J domain-containing protein n=1 Tax=Ferrovibrio sp. TaxID=1917215 RepID=UPI002B4ADEA6|nr:J domain-containing protein [Ferrovibrio sp.]HLT76891.1 J domain-containing protein [Ferrovibrio sp.]
MRDPYDVLGVARGASQEELRKAYRRLAKELHPDRNPGNAKATERFKEVSAAYDILGDPEKRAKFDRGEIDAAGQPRAQGFRGGYHPGGGAGAGGFRGGFGGARGPFGYGGFDPGAGDDIFDEIFGQMRRGRPGAGARRTSMPQRGADRRFSLKIAFMDAARGTKRRLTMPDGKQLDVTIPAGLADGQQIRLRHQGDPGINGGEAGDALIEVSVEPHAFFTRQNDDVHLELPVTLDEAVLGAKIAVPTIDGMVAVTVPKGASSGTTLRLKGRGFPLKGGASGQRGDQYVKLKIVLPEKPNSALEKLIEGWAKSNRYDVRAKYTVE